MVQAVWLYLAVGQPWPARGMLTHFPHVRLKFLEPVFLDFRRPALLSHEACDFADHVISWFHSNYKTKLYEFICPDNSEKGIELSGG